MPTASQALYVYGPTEPPYTGEWELISHQRYPDAEQSWEDAQLFEAEAKIGEALSLTDVLMIEQMVREKVIEEGGAPLESLVYSRLERLATGEAQMTYKVYHAAHASPIVWMAVVTFIAANWKAILIVLGILAATAALITFTIKSSSIIWKAGDKIEDLIEELPPALVGLGIGLVLLLALFALGGRKKETAK